MTELTAAILVIGDEILSGRTQDANIATIARFLNPFGIDLCEVRIVPDKEDEIVGAVRALAGRYAYVFTTGGIGPTHDDITADSIAKAFGKSIDYHPEALALLAARYKPGEFNEARKRMARVPDGATLIKNSVSTAPGFQLGNVFVMAGVPKIMQAMLDEVAKVLPQGTRVESRHLTLAIPEGTIAEELGAIQKRYPDVSIGSYPFFAEGARPPGTTLVARSRDQGHLSAVMAEMEAMARGRGAMVLAERPALRD